MYSINIVTIKIYFYINLKNSTMYVKIFLHTSVKPNLKNRATSLRFYFILIWNLYRGWNFTFWGTSDGLV